jgi:endonuclease III
MSTSLPDNLLSFDRAGKTRAANDLLELHYGRPQPELVEGRPDPLPRIIRSIVAQNTSRANQVKALDNLQRRFPDPALIAEASLADIIDAIYVAGLANVKAPRLQALIQTLLEATDGTLDLGFLYDLPVDEARAFLMNLPGVGPLSASLVLLFAMGRPVLPVNTGLHRVAQRVGMIPPNMDAERAHALLQSALSDADIYPFHVNAVTLARDFCLASRPRCADCPLAVVCRWAHGG